MLNQMMRRVYYILDTKRDRWDSNSFLRQPIKLETSIIQSYLLNPCKSSGHIIIESSD